tara:strand:- start:26 stop:475 length:450 start_codon:yes stop_codon:yes gene_type:complete
MTVSTQRLLPDLEATESIGRDIAKGLGPGDVVCLWGDLGAGKTALARAILRALGHAGEVPSPTFNLVLVYETPQGPVWHFDLYRLEAPAEALELGIEDAFADGISLIEWPDRLGGLLPPDRLDVRLEIPADGNGRTIAIEPQGAMAAPC